MQIKIVASTKQTSQASNEEFNDLSGKMAGICYMSDNLDSILTEAKTKTEKRVSITKNNRHHSVFEHSYITLYLENVPKIFAMLLNNQKVYTTSEKSARYTKMNVQGKEKFLYDKWIEILKQVISEKYSKYEYFTASRIEKLAQENARYFISVFTPTCMAYTTSYRQLNYLYNWLSNLENSNDKILKKLAPYGKEFCRHLEKLNIIDLTLSNGANGREISFITTKDKKEYFGDVYCTKYVGSFASFAQSQRHRTLNYEIKQLTNPQFFVPKILERYPQLKQMWIDDMQSVKDNYPQGELIEIYERGTPENFILKARERLCTCAQLEVMEQTKNTLNKYVLETEDKEIKNVLSPYLKGARCCSGEYKCNAPCKFKEGINLEREI